MTPSGRTVTVNPARAGMIPNRTAPPSITGSKPRASGDDPGSSDFTFHAFAVNPARAGMILFACVAAGIRRCKPRASGDDPAGYTYCVACLR